MSDSEANSFETDSKLVFKNARFVGKSNTFSFAASSLKCTGSVSVVFGGADWLLLRLRSEEELRCAVLKFVSSQQTLFQFNFWLCLLWHHRCVTSFSGRIN